MPVAPGEIEILYSSDGDVRKFVSGKENYIFKGKGLKTIKLNTVLPLKKESFARYKNNKFVNGLSIYNELVEIKNSGKPVRFTITRKLEKTNGKIFKTYSSKLKVFITDVDLKEDTEVGLSVSLTLKEAMTY